MTSCQKGIYRSLRVFCGMDDVLWLILVPWHVLSRNQPGATLAPLGKLFSSAVPSGSGDFQMSTCPSSSSSASTLKEGKGQSQKRLSNFLSFLAWSFFGMTLTTYHKKDLIFKGQKVTFVPILRFRSFSQTLVTVTFSLFWNEPSQWWY